MVPCDGVADSEGPRPLRRTSATPEARPFWSGTEWISGGDGSRLAAHLLVGATLDIQPPLGEDLKVKMTAGESRAPMRSGPTMAASVGVVTLLKVSSR